MTPATTFVAPVATSAEIISAATKLGGTAFVNKDWVKSRKYEWETAAYAPTLDDLPNVVAEFVRLQDEFLVGDVAIRQFIELDKTQPEVRVWWAHGRIALMTVHPDFSGARLPAIPDAFLDRVGEGVAELDCPFVTTDLAATTAGGWLVIEVGDGQVSGFPDNATPREIQSILSAVLAL